MATITSPGNKLWEFDYNDLGLPVTMDYSNGMVKEWTYDARDRLNKLTYTSPATEVTVVNHNFNWPGYMGLPGWTVVSGTWGLYSGTMRESYASTGSIQRDHSYADGELKFDYQRSANTIYADLRRQGTSAVRYDNVRITGVQPPQVLASYTYQLDDLFNVLKMTEADGTYWDYQYDDRYRLTSAVRNNKPSPTIKANYAYTYDAADNMLTKVEPFLDDFNDTNTTGWTVSSGTWSAANGYLAKTNVTGLGKLTKAHTDADGELRFDYRVTDTSTAATARVDLRSHSVGKVYLLITPGTIELKDFLVPTGGTTITLDTVSVGTTEDQWYTIRAEYDGGNVKVWRRTEGGLDTLLLSTTAARFMGTSSTAFSITPDGTDYEFDNIRILSDSLSTTTTFAVNAADELTSATVSTGGTTDFEYDAWGRMSRKYIGTSGSPTFEAIYDYKYDDKLVAVTSNFPDEGNVSYEYGSDGDLRTRTEGGVTRHFNSAGPARMTETDASGNLVRTYVGELGHIDGSNPATGDHSYYLHDDLGSIRFAYSNSGQATGLWEYSPYGAFLENQAAIPIDHGFTSEVWDPALGAYAFYFRHYNPTLARWTTREPSGEDGPNLYDYCFGNPRSAYDVLGLMTHSSLDKCVEHPYACDGLFNANKARRLANKARKMYPKLAKKPCHGHHLTPIFMGGNPKGPAVLIPAAYHQFITNAFRKALPTAGKGAYKSMPEAEAIPILIEVYKQFPLPPGAKWPGC